MLIKIEDFDFSKAIEQLLKYILKNIVNTSVQLKYLYIIYINYYSRTAFFKLFFHPEKIRAIKSNRIFASHT